MNRNITIKTIYEKSNMENILEAFRKVQKFQNNFEKESTNSPYTRIRVGPLSSPVCHHPCVIIRVLSLGYHHPGVITFCEEASDDALRRQQLHSVMRFISDGWPFRWLGISTSREGFVEGFTRCFARVIPW